MTIVETPKLSNPRMDPKDYTIRVANDDQAMKHAEACYEVVSWRKGMTFEVSAPIYQHAICCNPRTTDEI